MNKIIIGIFIGIFIYSVFIYGIFLELDEQKMTINDKNNLIHYLEDEIQLNRDTIQTYRDSLNKIMNVNINLIKVVDNMERQAVMDENEFNDSFNLCIY